MSLCSTAICCTTFLSAVLTLSPFSLCGVSVCVLCNKSYDTFCQAGHDIDKLLSTLGAQKCGDLLEINVLDSDLPEEYAVKWLPLWLNSL